MRSRVLFLVPVLAAAASAQWVDTTLAAPGGPWRFCHNPTNDKVYCTVIDSTSVMVIDGATNAVLATVPVDGDPQDVVYVPANNKVYCCNASSQSVSVIDGVTNNVPGPSCSATTSGALPTTPYTTSCIATLRAAALACS